MKSHSRGFTLTRTSESKGFTLIELLVVIAIIGLLASIILASLNTARQKGRDSRRVADLKEMANAMELANAGTNATNLAGCTTQTAAAGVNANTCTTPSLANYADPAVGGSGTVCTKTASASCQYIIFAPGGGTPTTQNYEVCSYLESGAGSLSSGPVNVSSTNSGNVSAGCS